MRLEKQHVLGAFLSCFLFFGVKSSFKLRVFQGQNDGLHNLICCHKAYIPGDEDSDFRAHLGCQSCKKELFLGYMHGKAQNLGRQGDTHAERICAKASSNLYGSHDLLFPLLPADDLSSFLSFVQLLITLLFTVLHRIPVTPPSLLPSLSAAL
ncbi:unnamed protein product, partial [Musa banksii]